MLASNRGAPQKVDATHLLRCGTVSHRRNTKSLSSFRVVASIESSVCSQMNWNNFECLTVSFLSTLIYLLTIPSSYRVQLCENDVKWHVYAFDFSHHPNNNVIYFLYTLNVAFNPRRPNNYKIHGVSVDILMRVRELTHIWGTN